MYAAAVLAGYPDLPAVDAETMGDEDVLLGYVLAVLVDGGVAPNPDDELRDLVRDLLVGEQDETP